MRMICDELLKLGVISSRAKKRLLLEPFIVEAALERMDEPLTLDEQKVVMRAIGNPAKVNWPDWWEAC